MIRYIVLMLIIPAIFIGCSDQPTNNDIVSFEEYDEGLNLKTNPILSLQEGQVIEFSLPSSSTYVLKILNSTGYSVRTYEGTASAGNTRIIWDLTNDSQKPVKLGIYIYELVAGGFKARTVTVVRVEL